MDAFEFLTVIISIVIAVAMSEVLVGWGRIIRFRATVKSYWLHTGWTSIIVVIMLRYWWSIWQFRTVEQWNFGLFIVMLAPALVLILIAFLLTPELTGSKPFEFRQYYYEHAGWFFSLGALYLVGTLFSSVIIRGGSALSAENGFRAAGIALMTGVAFSRNERFHQFAFVVALVALVLFLTSVQLTLE